jgi:hypothetical protein
MASRMTDEVARTIQLVLWHNRPSSLHGDRRGERRHPFPYPVHLLPVSADGKSTIGEPIVVLGKDLSEQGLGFYHSQPLAERHVLATFDCGEFRAKFLMELTWCRFGSHGLFENGGRFLQSLTMDDA